MDHFYVNQNLLKMQSNDLTQDEISIIDDRIEYYFENNPRTDDADELAVFVTQGGEIDGSKYEEIRSYIQSNL